MPKADNIKPISVSVSANISMSMYESFIYGRCGMCITGTPPCDIVRKSIIKNKPPIIIDIIVFKRNSIISIKRLTGNIKIHIKIFNNIITILIKKYKRKSSTFKGKNNNPRMNKKKRYGFSIAVFTKLNAKVNKLEISDTIGIFDSF